MNKEELIKPMERKYIPEVHINMGKGHGPVLWVLWLILWTLATKLMFAVWYFPLIGYWTKMSISGLYLGGLLLFMWKRKQ